MFLAHLELMFLKYNCKQGHLGNPEIGFIFYKIFYMKNYIIPVIVSFVCVFLFTIGFNSCNKETSKPQMDLRFCKEIRINNGLTNSENYIYGPDSILTHVTNATGSIKEESVKIAPNTLIYNSAFGTYDTVFLNSKGYVTLAKRYNNGTSFLRNTLTYFYDAEDHLIEIKNNGATHTVYNWQNGNLVSEISNGVRTDYNYEGNIDIIRKYPYFNGVGFSNKIYGTTSKKYLNGFKRTTPSNVVNYILDLNDYVIDSQTGKIKSVNYKIQYRVPDPLTGIWPSFSVSTGTYSFEYSDCN